MTEKTPGLCTSPARVETFAAFMARALHDPQQGYYARRIQTVGARGDFSTAATLSPHLGQAIAAWLRLEFSARPQVRHVIEIGGGDGSLMARVRSEIGWWKRRSLHWHMVESSQPLQDKQKALLGSSVNWHSTIEQALAASAGQAFIYHNELLDAFPAHLVEFHQGEWSEMGLDASRREVRLHLDWPEEQRRHFSIFTHWPVNLPPSQRCELHASVLAWFQAWAPHWRTGSMLTVDYGDEFPALYHRRPHGTLRAYLLQQRLEGGAIYANPGRQDITCDINFTDLRAWTATLGWQEVGFGCLADFFRAHIKPQSLATIPPSFLAEEGAGGAFKWQAVRK